ncbi:hypothetical protein ARMGADRAFT_916999 [Armillaria gallica]|uniref:Uncharacterized protein n=1 Tax=Armillaria gallica TaxID=47427 RepID=A0A2H3EGE5_ARMGA|nr:hypothetical protein ARMGADRAFT_916999 [Armillaria gallica]
MWLCFTFHFPLRICDYKQGTAHLRLVHPTPGDIPSCPLLMEVSTDCHSFRSQVKSWYPYHDARISTTASIYWQEIDGERPMTRSMDQ